jgi:hypothetical protein
MTENWSSRDVERDPQGFLEAQCKERERIQAERESADLERAARETHGQARMRAG